ncbi:PrgI family protein [Agathobacter rectalis]|jgi:hypothetical protein|uniref:PrgI family protein n=1 Tax=Agathobacter rectalis TaxID=39491 RepID=A0A3E5ALW2_9FIRM|nr:PrgI family protein [Agathobacter rectalis]MBO9144135.1 PrgI family protein [Escherichia coli]RGN16391.1 PrgI family protein [Agathobacter rectalis]RGN21516.1 PrgI family protein [Agathobacter rectalis]RGN21824.1 PrgI family protein [Agathobacter rectalis]
MLSVKTNKEVTEFKSDFMGGFGFKQSMAILGGVAIGMIIMCSLIFFTHIPIVLAPYAALPFISIPILSAFYNKDGMGFLKHRKKVKEFKKMKACIYISTESDVSYTKCLMEQQKKAEKNSDDAFQKTLKKLIIIGIITAVLIIGGIIAIVVIKLR